MQVFGLEMELPLWAFIVIIVLVILTIAGLISIFYYYRKKLWYGAVGALLSIFIG